MIFLVEEVNDNLSGAAERFLQITTFEVYSTQAEKYMITQRSSPKIEPQELRRW